MWILIKTAWSVLSILKNFKGYALAAILIGLAAGGLYAIHASQARTISKQAEVIENAGKKLGTAKLSIQSLQKSLELANHGQAAAEGKYIHLDAEQQANSKRLKEVERENNALRKRMAQAQKNDLGANSLISDDIKRMHNEAIRDFNEKYGSGDGTTQAGDPARSDVRNAGGNIR